jgi:hypothetical protein
VFRITKNQHNILQGVSHPDQRISDAEKAAINDWIEDNAKRYWLSEGGPLRPPEEGGADVIIVGQLFHRLGTMQVNNWCRSMTLRCPASSP